MLSQQAIYLDYNATTPVRPEVRDAVLSVLEHVGNPSSVHGCGRYARSLVEQAREQIARLINSRPQDIIFTSSGTEANNQVLKAWPERHLFVSSIEHDSVRDVETQRQTPLPVGADGRLDVQESYDILADYHGSALVALMAVNNETGIKQPVKELVRAIKSLNDLKGKDILVHCDAVQAVGKIPVDMVCWGVDSLSLSAHKIGGMSGIGALVHRPGLSMPRLIDGGGQERRLRAGTENVAGIVGFGEAALCSANELRDGELSQRLTAWRMQLVDAIGTSNPNVVFLSENEQHQIGTTINLSLPGVRADTLVMKADLAGMAISAGSACSSGKINHSPVALAMGFDTEIAQSSVRLSIGWGTTTTDIDTAIKKFPALIEQLEPKM